MRALLIALFAFAVTTSSALAQVAPGPAIAPSPDPTFVPGTTASPAAAVAGEPVGANGSGSIAALNGATIVPLNSASGVSFTVSGTWVATLSVKASSDGVTFPWSVTCVSSAGTAAQSMTANGSEQCNVGSYADLEVVASAYTSGTASIAWHRSANAAPTLNADGANIVALDTANGLGSSATLPVYNRLVGASGTAATVSTGSTVAPVTNGFLQVYATLAAYDVSSAQWEGLTKDPQTRSALWVASGGSATLALSASGVLKNSSGRSAVCEQMTAATTAGVATIYDNASAASGTAILTMPIATTLSYTPYATYMPAANGMYFSDTATGGSVTCGYF